MLGMRQTGAVVFIGPERGELSSSAAMIEAEQAAETFVADDLARVREKGVVWVNELVVDALMGPLGIEVGNVRRQGTVE